MPERSIDDADAAYRGSAKRTRSDDAYVPPVTRFQTSPLGQLKAVATKVDRAATKVDVVSAIDMIGPTLPLQDPGRIDRLIERIGGATRADRSRALRLMGDYVGTLTPHDQRKLADAALLLVQTARTGDQLVARIPELAAMSDGLRDADSVDAAIFLKQCLQSVDIDADLRTHIDGRLRAFSRRPHIGTLLGEVDRDTRNGFGDHDRMHVRSGDIEREIETIRDLAADRAVPKLKALIDRTMAERQGDVDRMIQAARAIPIVHAAARQEQARDRPDRSRSRRGSIGR